MLRLGDRYAASGRTGAGGAALYAVLQYGALLAFAGGHSYGLLCAAGAAGYGAGRAERRGGHAAGVGAAAAGDAEAAVVSVVSLREVAPGRQTDGFRLRPLVQPERP